MKHILVLAYAISPTRGSEYSVAWNYVTRMNKYHKITVLYGTSGDHLGDTGELESYLREHPLPNTRFVFVKPTKLTNWLNILNKKGLFVYSFYLAYKQWHKTVYKKAQEMTKQEHFDLIHFLAPISYREPGYLWKINLPYVWGPVGGTNNIPLRLWGAVYSFSGKSKLLFRTLANLLQLYFSPRIRQAFNKCDILLTATVSNQKKIERIHHIKSIWLPENGITGTIYPVNPKKIEYSKMHLIWIGRIDANKALIILLKALTKITSESPVLLHVVGDGPLRKKMEKFATAHHIDHLIKWHGKLKREEVFDVLKKSHLHIITSLSEGNPTTIWEAMSYGVPTMALDHCGMHDVICEKCGIKIPVRSYKQIINDISKQLLHLINHPEQIRDLAEGAAECAQKYKWENRIKIFNDLYKEIIIKHESIKNL